MFHLKTVAAGLFEILLFTKLHDIISQYAIILFFGCNSDCKVERWFFVKNYYHFYNLVLTPNIETGDYL
jgi:hypothetical protein